MELSSFSENIVTVPLKRGGESVELSVNIDIFTPEFFREVGLRFTATMKALDVEDKANPKTKRKKVADRVQFFEDEARALEINRDIYADMLSSGVLVAWTITENGIPIAPSKEVLSKLSPRLVQELWEKCLEAAKTVKKTADVETIPPPMMFETTETGSREFTIPLSAPIM